MSSPASKWKQHLWKAGQQNRAWRGLKWPGRKPPWPLTWQTPVHQHQLLWDLPVRAAWILLFLHCSKRNTNRTFFFKRGPEPRCLSCPPCVILWNTGSSCAYSSSSITLTFLRWFVSQSSQGCTSPCCWCTFFYHIVSAEVSTKCAWIQHCEKSQLLQPRPLVSYPPCREHRRSPAPWLCSLLKQTETI